MKVKELVEKLKEVDPELEVELTVNDGDITQWELQEINLKWESLGVISLESNNCILN